jgi:hypothetical protein
MVCWDANCGGSQGSHGTNIRTAVLYNHFMPLMLISLEELGFAAGALVVVW